MYIYASHPAELNDPYDCDISLIDFDDESVIKFFAKEAYDLLVHYFPDQKERQEFCQKAYQDIIYTKCGIFSLAPRRNQISMWSHYTKNIGFCVEFDVNKFPFAYFGPYPINYSDNLTSVKVSEWGIQRAMVYQTNVKKSCWSNEEEWRLLISNPHGVGNFESKGEYADALNSNPNVVKRIMKYPKAAIRSVTFAINFFDENEFYTITQEESEVQCEDSLKCRILDFLLLTKIPISLAVKTGAGLIDFNNVELYKLRDNVYRIIRI